MKFARQESERLNGSILNNLEVTESPTGDDSMPYLESDMNLDGGLIGKKFMLFPNQKGLGSQKNSSKSQFDSNIKDENSSDKLPSVRKERSLISSLTTMSMDKKLKKSRAKDGGKEREKKTDIDYQSDDSRYNST
jgi:hypothetical protein